MVGVCRCRFLEFSYFMAPIYPPTYGTFINGFFSCSNRLFLPTKIIRSMPTDRFFPLLLLLYTDEYVSAGEGKFSSIVISEVHFILKQLSYWHHHKNLIGKRSNSRSGPINTDMYNRSVEASSDSILLYSYSANTPFNMDLRVLWVCLL